MNIFNWIRRNPQSRSQEEGVSLMILVLEGPSNRLFIIKVNSDVWSITRNISISSKQAIE